MVYLGVARSWRGHSACRVGILADMPRIPEPRLHSHPSRRPQECGRGSLKGRATKEPGLLFSQLPVPELRNYPGAVARKPPTQGPLDYRSGVSLNSAAKVRTFLPGFPSLSIVSNLRKARPSVRARRHGLRAVSRFAWQRSVAYSIDNVIPAGLLTPFTVRITSASPEERPSGTIALTW